MTKEIISLLLSILLPLPLMMMFSSSFNLVLESANIYQLLVVIGDKLSESEEKRLDNLLSSGKNFHQTALIISGLLLAFASLPDFDEFLSPIGNVVFPSVQITLVLYIIVVSLLIATDYIFLMAYPWLKLDKRRPPFNWFMMGLNLEKHYPIHIWLYLPLVIASIGMMLLISLIEFPSYIILLSGISVVFFPRIIFYLSYLILQKEDHRGGPATFSIYILYIYRLLRQIIFTLIIFLPIFTIIPVWKEFIEKTIIILAISYYPLFILRYLLKIKRIYKWIDKKGKIFGFSIESKNYN